MWRAKRILRWAIFFQFLCKFIELKWKQDWTEINTISNFNLNSTTDLMIVHIIYGKTKISKFCIKCNFEWVENGLNAFFSLHQHMKSNESHKNCIFVIRWIVKMLRQQFESKQSIKNVWGLIKSKTKAQKKWEYSHRLVLPAKCLAFICLLISLIISTKRIVQLTR